MPRGRLPPRAAAGAGGPPRHLAEAGAAAGVDESRRVRRDAGGADGAGAARPGQGPDEAGAGPGGGDHAGGRQAIPGAGAGRAVPPEVARGIGSAFVEDGDGDGGAADQDAGDGAQGGGDAPAGVQPDPWDHGRGRSVRWPEAAAAELHGRGAYGALVRGGAFVRPGADPGGPATAAGAGRAEASGGPPGPLRAACGEAAAEAASAASHAAEEGKGVDQTRDNPLWEKIGTKLNIIGITFAAKKACVILVPFVSETLLGCVSSQRLGRLGRRGRGMY